MLPCVQFHSAMKARFIFLIDFHFLSKKDAFLLTDTQSLCIISLIEEVRANLRGGTTLDTDARGLNMIPETERHEKLIPNKGKHS